MSYNRQSKGRYAGFSVSLLLCPFMLPLELQACLSELFSCQKKNNPSVSSLPRSPPPAKFHPQNSAKLRLLPVQKRECLQVHKNNCLEKSLERAEHHLSSSSREPLHWVARMQCVSLLWQWQFSCLSVARGEKGSGIGHFWEMKGSCSKLAWTPTLRVQTWSLPGTCWPWEVKQPLLRYAWILPGILLYNLVPSSTLLFLLWLSKLCVGASKNLVFKQISFAQSAVQCVHILLLQTGGKVAKWFLQNLVSAISSGTVYISSDKGIL